MRSGIENSRFTTLIPQNGQPANNKIGIIMTIANIETGKTQTPKKAKPSTQTGRRPTVKFTKDTKVTFTTKKNQPQLKPARSLEELASRMFGINNKNQKIALTVTQAAKYLRSIGYSWNDYTWGLEKSEFHRSVVLSFYANGGDLDLIQPWLRNQGIEKTTHALYQAVYTMLGVYSPVDNDIERGTREMPRTHSPLVHTVAAGGMAYRLNVPGVYRLQKVNIRLSWLSMGLGFPEAHILILYGDIIGTKRPAWIFAHHYETYGRLGFRAIIKKFYPMLLNTIIKIK